MKHKVRRKDREGKAGPDDGFGGMDVETLRSGHTADQWTLKETSVTAKLRVIIAGAT